jgi:hypothetical protein
MIESGESINGLIYMRKAGELACRCRVSARLTAVVRPIFFFIYQSHPAATLVGKFTPVLNVTAA